MADRSVNVRLTASIGGFKSAMAEAGAASRKAAGDTQAAWRDTGSVTGNAIQASQKYSDSWHQVSNAAVIGGTAIVGAVGMAISKYADFDAAMSNVKASTHESAENMNLLRQAALSAGKDTAYSAVEAASAIDELAKAGVSTKDILGGGLKGALSLAAAGQMDVGEAAEIAATAMTQFGLKGTDVGHVADLLAAGAGKAQGSVTDMGYALKQGGLVAAQAGISIEETTGTLAAFASAGLIGSDAGTSFKSMLQHLQNPSKEAAGTMKELGISMYDSQGNFVGMANLAEQLKNGMQDLTPAQRDAAMATIFGSDAVRAANVLYAQGGQGIQDWIGKVNDAGFAAETAAIKQDNLKGDLEKLKGAFETVFLSAGGSGNDALRTFVQSLTNIVDAVGKIPTPVLEAAGGITAFVGAAALVAGGTMKAVSAFNSLREGISLAKDLFGSITGSAATAGTAIDGLSTNAANGAERSTRFSKSMQGISTAAAGLAVLTIGVEALRAWGNAAEEANISSEQLKNAFADTSNGVKNVDAAFQSAAWANGNGSAMWDGTVQGVNGVADAVVNLQNLNPGEKFSAWGNDLLGFSDANNQAKDAISKVDGQLAAMVSSGNMEAATASFKQWADQVKEQGGNVEQMAQQFPQLQAAILDYASSLGVTLTPQETLSAMMGEMPQKLTDAAGSSKAAADGLAQIGASAETAAKPLKDVMDAMSALGLAQMSMTEAQGAYSQSVRDLGSALAENAFQLNANGTAFDVTTESGYKAQQAFNAVAQAGFDMVESMANNGASQGELQGALQQTYNDLVNNGAQFGLTASQADTLARATLGIPDGVDIETWMSDNAQRMAESTDKAVNNIPDSHHTDSSMSPAAHTEADNTTSAIKNIPGGHHTDSSMAATARAEADRTRDAINNVANYHHTDSSMSTLARDVANQTQGAIAGIERNVTVSINVFKTSHETILAQHKSTGATLANFEKSSGGLATSGVRGYATGGGVIPGGRPSNIFQDNLLGVIGGTGELITVQSNEFITRGKQVEAGMNLAWLEWINKGGVMRTNPPGFAEGGSPAFRGVRGFSNNYRFDPTPVAPVATAKDSQPQIGQLVMNTPAAPDPDRYGTRAAQSFARTLRKVGIS